MDFSKKRTFIPFPYKYPPLIRYTLACASCFDEKNPPSGENTGFFDENYNFLLIDPFLHFSIKYLWNFGTPEDFFTLFFS